MFAPTVSRTVRPTSGATSATTETRTTRAAAGVTLKEEEEDSITMIKGKCRQWREICNEIE